MNLMNNLERGFSIVSAHRTDTEIVDKTIERLPRCIDKIIAVSGGRTRY